MRVISIEKVIKPQSVALHPVREDIEKIKELRTFGLSKYRRMSMKQQENLLSQN